MPHPCVCLVTDRRALRRDARTTTEEIDALKHQLDDAIAAGIDLIQIRERDLDARLLSALVTWVVAKADGTPAHVLVNDRADVAVISGADGVHVRADGPPVASVRAVVGDRLVGRSVHSAGEAAGAPEADYLIFGTVFRSESKPAGAPVAGLALLREATAAARAVPVLAIGGITPARVPDIRAAGAAGVAGISLFLPSGRASDALGAADAIRRIREAWG